MRVLVLLALLTLGACRSNFRLELPPDHPARPEQASEPAPEIPDPARVRPSDGEAQDPGEARPEPEKMK